MASRGLDISDVKFVVNYDYPNSSEDYIHRIGRTARADKAGTSYTFFTHDNANKARDLIQVLQEAKQQVGITSGQNWENEIKIILIYWLKLSVIVKNDGLLYINGDNSSIYEFM